MNQSLVPSSILLSLLSLVSWLTLSACSPIPERLTPSLSNASAIIEKNAPFTDYISHSRHLIQAARVDLDSTAKETIIQANSPFEYRPSSEQCKNPSGRFQYKRGILLIHGLTASPYMMEDLARFFHARCFLVRAILLPGHGTRPGDLLDIHYQDWVKTVDYGVRSFKGQVEDLFLAGYSLGGALAVHYTLSQHVVEKSASAQQRIEYSWPSINGLFLFSPALKAKSRWTFLAGTVSLFKDWMSITSDRDYASYESFPYNAAAQSHQIIDTINDQINAQQTFPIPVFVALSEDDETIDSSHTIDLFRRIMNSGQSYMQLYTHEPENYSHDQHIEALQSQLDNDNILNFSHTAITVPGNHPHYGMNGDYRRCLHYPEQSTKWLVCSGDSDIAQGEISQINLEQHTLRQLIYNPYFSRMLNAMDQFLKPTEK